MLQVPNDLKNQRSQSSEIREEKLFEDITTAVEYINDYPGRNMREISVKLGWTIGKAQNILNQAEEFGSIFSETVIIKGRANRRFYNVPWYNRMDWQNMDDNVAKEKLVAKVVKEQTKAHNTGYSLKITDKSLQEKVNEYFKNFYTDSN